MLWTTFGWTFLFVCPVRRGFPQNFSANLARICFSLLKRHMTGLMYPQTFFSFEGFTTRITYLKKKHIIFFIPMSLVCTSSGDLLVWKLNISCYVIFVMIFLIISFNCSKLRNKFLILVKKWLINLFFSKSKNKNKSNLHNIMSKI